MTRLYGCMAKNVSFWPSGRGLYIIKKEKHQSFSPKQGGIMVWTKLPFRSNMGQKIEKTRLKIVNYGIEGFEIEKLEIF